MLRVSSVHGALTLALFAAACGNRFESVTALDRDSHDPSFPIAPATKHESIDCNDCHGEFNSFRDFTCVGCHDGTHALEQIDPTHATLTGYVYERTSCLACHPRSELLSDAYHDPFFPVGVDTPHTGLDCAECHVVEGDRKQYTCTDCHAHQPEETAAEHEGVVDYAHETPECYACHPDGNGLPRDLHTERHFPIEDPSAHREIQCKECHRTPDRTVYACIDCHGHEPDETASEHGLVGGYDYSSALCLRCHIDSSVYRVSEHLPFIIDRGAHDAGNAPCLRCHTEPRADRPEAADFVSFDCRPCHECAEMDKKHDDREGYQCVSTTCVMSGCHPDGRH